MSDPTIIGGATLYNCDCMEYMRGLPDKAFELAIVDPPYGIGIDGQKGEVRNKRQIRKAHDFKGWDTATPRLEYFEELARVSNHQIIWGANYFVEFLKKPSKGWAVWFKGQEGLTMSDCELAYSSIDTPTRVINLHRTHLWQEQPIHPTQKPVKLYEWLLTNYAKPGDRILDTHLGSGSSAIACLNLGFEIVGCELDADYFAAACKRIRMATAQERLFA
jgi:site-specific DNA-methyltransferase (adenine-specific)